MTAAATSVGGAATGGEGGSFGFRDREPASGYSGEDPETTFAVWEKNVRLWEYETNFFEVHLTISSLTLAAFMNLTRSPVEGRQPSLLSWELPPPQVQGLDLPPLHPQKDVNDFVSFSFSSHPPSVFSHLPPQSSHDGFTESFWVLLSFVSQTTYQRNVVMVARTPKANFTKDTSAV